jgi:hypothetical protein
MQSPGQPANNLSLPDRIAQVKDLEERLQTHYLKNCDTADPFFQLCATVARLIVARSWLFVYYPLIQKNDRTKLPAGVRDQFFQTSIRVLEQTNILLTSPDNAKWVWHSKTHIQWHAVAIVLSEICSCPLSAEYDRAWDYMQTIYDRWRMKEHKGNLWRPIKRLMAKAEYVREKQRRQGLRPKRHWRVAGVTSTSSDALTLGLVDRAASGANDQSSVLSMESLESFIEMHPEPKLFGSTLGVPCDAGFAMANWADDTHDLNFEKGGYDLE